MQTFIAHFTIMLNCQLKEKDKNLRIYPAKRLKKFILWLGRSIDLAKMVQKWLS